MWQEFLFQIITEIEDAKDRAPYLPHSCFVQESFCFSNEGYKILLECRPFNKEVIIKWNTKRWICRSRIWTEWAESGARDVCLVDFQTLELYSLQEHYISHYIRDYYVQINARDGDELEVIGIYAPVLENGERLEE